MSAMLVRIGGPAMSDDWCDECGELHDQAHRLIRLRRMLPASVIEIKQALSCLYPPETCHTREANTADRRLFRDLHKLGAFCVQAYWQMPRRAALPQPTEQR